jgi:hypothetical protein
VNKLIYCTVTSNQYLFLAIGLAKSIKRTDPGARVLMCLNEENYSFASPYLEHFDHVILAKELGFSNFYHHMFKHNAYEASGSCKARLMLYALNKFQDEDHFVFLDADMKVFGPFDEIKESLNHHSIILTPHILESGIYEDAFLTAGVFNTGFFAIKRSAESYHFLNWWTDRIEKACFNEQDKGLFLEQKWLDHAPSFFNVNICKHPGYNVAAWNLHQRKIEMSTVGDYKVNGQPLRLFHFTGIYLFWKKYIEFLNSRYGLSNLGPEIERIVNQYISELVQVGIDVSTNVSWSYDYYADGKRIAMDARLAFRQNHQMFAHIVNPFLESNLTFLQRKTKERALVTRKKKSKRKIKINGKKFKNKGNRLTKKTNRRIKGKQNINMKKKLKVK